MTLQRGFVGRRGLLHSWYRMADAAVEAPQPPADVVPRAHDELVAMKQPWITKTVSDREKEGAQYHVNLL